jgi:hypothetical protein
MLSQTRGLRLALVLVMSLGYVAWHGHAHVVYAASDDDDEEDDGGDDGGDEGGDEEEDEEEDPGDQPPVTAGGLFTMKTYPVRELFRPLTMTERLGQLRLGLGTDVSAKGAFESAGLSVEAIYGLKDNFSLIGGVTNSYNFKQFAISAGFEASLAYDLVDFRLAFDVNRPAIADPPMDDGMGNLIPTGKYTAGKTHASFDIGFPFRYVAKPEIAIIALNTLMSIDLDSKPDLLPSLGISTNPIPALSVVIFAQLRIPDFDTTAGNLKVPATVRASFSPNQKLDLGLEFTFLNVKPSEGEGKFYDNRFLTLFVQSRFGR